MSPDFPGPDAKRPRWREGPNPSDQTLRLLALAGVALLLVLLVARLLMAR